MNNDDKKQDIDSVTGIETTGHEWDGIKELNNPAPRWWLIIFIVTVVWSVGYWVIYPAWPTLSGATKGAWAWTEYKKLKSDQAEIAARQALYTHEFAQKSFDEIMQDPKLYTFAVAGGNAAFKNNCATCHGTGASGGKGYPNLNDDDWLWGGTLEDIHQTLQYGVRSGHDESRLSQMPAFGRDNLLKKDEIEKVIDYVAALSQGTAADTMPGHEIFKQNCASCHGEQGQGDRTLGAPRLSDKIWLYGSDRQSLYRTVSEGRNGVMPYWKGRLDDETIRQLAVYVYSLGGGEEKKPEPVKEEKVDDNGEPDAVGPQTPVE